MDNDMNFFRIGSLLVCVPLTLASAAPATANFCQTWMVPEQRMESSADAEMPTPLALLWEEQSPETIAACVNSWDPSTRDREGLSPLHYAAAFGRDDLVSAIVQTGVRVNSLSKNKRQALHVAANYDQASVVEALIANGAKFRPAEKYHPSAIEFAVRSNSDSVIGSLVALRALAIEDPLPTDLMEDAVRKGYADVVAELAQSGMDVNVPLGDVDRRSGIYHYIHKAKSIETLQALITAGADVNAKNSRGNTPLHGAVISGRPKLVDFLLAAGADVNARNTFGETPMHGIGAVSAGPGMGKDRLLRLAQTLEEAGADPAAQSNSCKTPYERIRKKSIAAFKGKVRRYLYEAHKQREKSCIPQ